MSSVVGDRGGDEDLKIDVCDGFVVGKALGKRVVDVVGNILGFRNAAVLGAMLGAIDDKQLGFLVGFTVG